MLGFAKLHRRIAASLVRLDQVDRIELVAAVVALVAARFAVTADWARALDVAIGQGTAGGRIESSHLLLFDQVALLIKGQEQLLRGAVVIRGRGSREHVVGHAETAKVLDDQRSEEHTS